MYRYGTVLHDNFIEKVYKYMIFIILRVEENKRVSASAIEWYNWDFKYSKYMKKINDGTFLGFPICFRV